MMHAIRRLLGWLGLPVGADVDPVRERLQRHDTIAAELVEAGHLLEETRQTLERQSDPITARVRGRHSTHRITTRRRPT